MIPPGYRIYAAVVERFDDVREVGGGLTFRCPVTANHKNGDRHPSCRAWIGDRGQLISRCMACGADWTAIAEACCTPLGLWFPDQGKRQKERRMHPQAKPVAEYEYRSRLPGHPLLATKTRWEPGFDGRSKDFTWRRPIPDEFREQLKIPQGVSAYATSLKGGLYAWTIKNGAWEFHKPKGDEQSTMLPDTFVDLYRIPELMAAKPKEPIFVVEGEKCVEGLRALGFTATTGYAGMGKWDMSWSGHFRGRRVVVVPDRDAKDVAMEYGHKVAATCIYADAASVRVVKLPIPELKPNMVGGDIMHWLAFGVRAKWSRDQKRAAVIELCKGFGEWRLYKESA